VTDAIGSISSHCSGNEPVLLPQTRRETKTGCDRAAEVEHADAGTIDFEMDWQL